jgi:hypothetical protein
MRFRTGVAAALSAQKFSSNVVQKCLELADGKQRAAMLDQFVSSPER